MQLRKQNEELALIAAIILGVLCIMYEPVLIGFAIIGSIVSMCCMCLSLTIFFELPVIALFSKKKGIKHKEKKQVKFYLVWFLLSFLYLCGSLGFLLGTPLIIFFSKDQNQINKAKKQFINNLIIFLASCSLFFLACYGGGYLLLHDISV